jgi:MFS family permease
MTAYQQTSGADPTVKNVLLLCGALALSNTGAVAVMVVTALSGLYLAQEGVVYNIPFIGAVPEKALSTLALSVQFIGTMAAAPPAALLMVRVGRRAGFILGQLIGASGAGLAVYALFAGSFWTFVAAGALIGIHNAFWQQFRFAVADTASDGFRARAISYVMFGPIVAGLLGPGLAQFTMHSLEPVLYAGAYVTVAVLCFLAISVLQFIDIPVPPRRKPGDSRGRPIRALFREPKFVIAVLAGMVGYSSMSFLMTATPLAMVACGLSETHDVPTVIAAHVIAMFAPSLVTGSLIQRYGAYRVILCGAALYLSSIGVNLTGETFVQFFTSLILVGVAWNFMFVGGTTLLTEFATPEEKAKVQGVNDFLVFGSVAMASLFAGAFQHFFGWSIVFVSIAGPVLVAALCILLLQGRAMRPAPAE